MRRIIAVVVLILGLLAVGGCSTDGVVAFEREQTAADIPDVDYEGWAIERDSVRFLAEEAGVQYFVARGDDEVLCLVQVVSADPDLAGSACAGSGLGAKWGSGPMLELVVPDMGERPGWRKLAPNLYAQD